MHKDDAKYLQNWRYQSPENQTHTGTQNKTTEQKPYILFNLPVTAVLALDH